MINKQTHVRLEIGLFTHIYDERIYNAVRGFNMHRCIFDLDTFLLRLIINEKNEMESIYLKFIDNQAVKIQWCTCTPKIHKNDKNTTSPYK